jgi:uncharacterized protein involved in type VI secretion and phage assembly
MTGVPDGAAPGYYGVYPAFVTKITDPPRQGQVEVRFPSLGTDGDGDVRAWATLCSPYADPGHGLEIIPEVGSQVLVAFAAGQFREPYVVGACWNGKAAPPEKPTQTNDLRLLQSRANSRLTFDDTAGAAKVIISMSSGHQVVLDDAAQQVVIKHAAGPVITLTQAGAIELSSTTVSITAAVVDVHAPTANFDGMINCANLTASVGVTSPLYSIGVGNLL